MNEKILWPEVHEDALRKLIPTGLSMQQIANELALEFAGTATPANYSRNAIIGKITRLGLRDVKREHSTHVNSKPKRARRPKKVYSTTASTFAPKIGGGVVESKPLLDISAPPNSETNKTLETLGEFDCRWIIAPNTYCGAKTVWRKSYCAFHSNQGTTGAKVYARPYVKWRKR